MNEKASLMKSLHMTAYTLLWVGGINWGLVGLFGFNLVEMLFGSMPALVNLVYVLVGHQLFIQLQLT